MVTLDLGFGKFKKNSYIYYMKTYIYILIDPISNQIRYVGKSNNPEKRYKNHKNRCRDKNTHKRNWINKLKLKGFNPEIEIIDTISIKEWKFWEKFWIQYFRTIGCKLTNHCNGGEGLSFGNKTSFKKGQISWNKGKGNIKKCLICNKEFQSSVTAKKVTCSKECSHIIRSIATKRTQFSKGNIGWNKGLKGRKLKPDKNVYQFNKEKTIMIKKWNTAKEAGDTLNINIEGIGQCARGISKSCGGYYWNYKNILL